MSRFINVVRAVILSTGVVPCLHAQEVVLPLYDNPAAARASTSGSVKKTTTLDALLELPLFDDFSNSDVLPDPAIWSDAYAFANNRFAVDPVTNGVATLDALDADGSIYPNAVLDPNTFVADYLTSHPVAMEYPASDSIYLSFLYQPAGLCDPPEEQDSLMVDFYAPDSARWVNVWSITGSGVQPFRQVMIPVTAPEFLKEGFRFRFRNRASLSRNNDYPDKRSNVDYWHIDYVRLGRNRFRGDTIMRDVAFNTPLNSILKDLTSLPWSQFEEAYNTVLDQYAFARYRNNDDITRNVTRSLSVEEPYYNETYTPTEPTAQDLPAMTDTVVNFGYIYPLQFGRGDSALLRFKASLRTDEFDPKVNDTVVHDQIFSNYFSYDDGTPEAGYGLRGGGTRDGMVALRYHSYEPALLGGVYFQFNHVYDSINLKYYFKLMVWNEGENGPGTVAWEDENDHTPRYSSTYPGFVRYDFSQPVPVDGTFYVGWRQYNEYLLNAGLDLNNRPSVMFYNIQGTWEHSQAPGVLMMRPFLYDPTTGTESRKVGSVALLLYPNPASDMVTLVRPPELEGTELLIEVFDASGRTVTSSTSLSDRIDVSSLPEGLYYLRAIAGKRTYQSKLVINR